MVGSLTLVAGAQVCIANDRGQQIRQRFERRKVDVRPLPPADDRTSLPVEHPQRHFELGRAAGQATVGYGNAAPDERTVDGDLLPGPRVELVENPAFGGTAGVRESSCTTTDVPTLAFGGRTPAELYFGDRPAVLLAAGRVR